MTRRAGYWAAVGGLAFLHFLLHLGFGIGREAPDLLTVALLLAVRTGGVGRGAGLGFAAGLLEDAFSVLAFGANTVAMTVVGVLGAATRTLFLGDSLVFFVAYLAAGKWVRDLLHWFAAGEAVREPFVESMLLHSAGGALYAAAVGAVVVAATGVAREARA